VCHSTWYRSTKLTIGYGATRHTLQSVATCNQNFWSEQAQDECKELRESLEEELKHTKALGAEVERLRKHARNQKEMERCVEEANFRLDEMQQLFDAECKKAAKMKDELEVRRISVTRVLGMCKWQWTLQSCGSWSYYWRSLYTACCENSRGRRVWWGTASHSGAGTFARSASLTKQPGNDDLWEFNSCQSVASFDVLAFVSKPLRLQIYYGYHHHGFTTGLPIAHDSEAVSRVNLFKLKVAWGLLFKTLTRF